MNNPLSYQATEYDCGPTALRNAISYLYDRKDIHPEILKYINLYCMDCHSQDGEPCKNGTSRVAMAFMANWLNQYGQVKKWPICCQELAPEEVCFREGCRIVEALHRGAVAVLRVTLECAHYVLLTGAQGDTVEMFDPYYWQHDFGDPGIQPVEGLPERMNRRVRWDVLNRDGEGFYNLGPPDRRQCLLLFHAPAAEPLPLARCGG